MRGHKHYERPNCEQDHRIAHDAITKFFIPWRSEIFLHRHRIHIANAAAVQITRGGMMNCMAVLPLVKRCERHHAHYQAYQFIGPHRSKERTMAAIMEDDEQTHHEPSCRN